MTVEVAILVGALVSCFAIAAVLALAEVSLIRIRRSEVMVAAATDRRSDQLLALLDDLPVVLNTILLFVLFTQVTAASIGTYLANRWFGGLGVTAVTVGLSATLFVYAEAIPKTIAVRSPLRVARTILPVLRPVVRVGGVLAAGLLRVAGLGSLDQPSIGALTESELLALAAESASAGAISHEDADLFERSIEFGDQTVGEIMVPRDKVRFVDVGRSVNSALSDAIGWGHRRLLVTAGSIDSIVGVVSIRDLAASRDAAPDLTAAEVMSDALRCPPERRIEDLLRTMQSTRCHIVAVESAEGRTLGVATVEDIVAELVGEIDEIAQIDGAG